MQPLPAGVASNNEAAPLLDPGFLDWLVLEIFMHFGSSFSRINMNHFEAVD